jgi:hypothetical protein
MKKWKTIASVIIVFLLGAAAGAIVNEFYQQRIGDVFRNEPRSMRELIVRRLHHELDLDPAQTEQVRVIVSDTQTRMREVRRRFRPELEEIMAHSQEQIRAILRPYQRERYERIIAEHRRRRMHRQGDQ